MEQHPNHHQHQPPHTPYGAQFFDELNAGLALSAQLRLPTQTDSSQPQHSQGQHSQPQQQQQTTPHNPRATDLASNHSIYLRPVPELPSEEEVHLNHDDLMEAVHAYGVRTGCDLVRHAQKTTSKGQPPYRWMMLCSRAGNPPATTPTIRTNTKSKKTQCPFGFWCVALDRLNPLTSQYRIKLSDGHNQHNHAPATFAELPNAKRRARRAGIEPPAAVVLSRQGPLRPSKIELQMDFRVCVQVNPVIPLGAGPWGQRNVIGFQGGTFTAAWARGTVEVIPRLFPSTCKEVCINLSLSLSARRSRLSSRPPRLPAHLRLDKLLDPHPR
jgi:hypothetical protein